jgi:hypothetical protein
VPWASRDLIDQFDAISRGWGWEQLAQSECARNAHRKERIDRWLPLKDAEQWVYESLLSWQQSCRRLADFPRILLALAKRGRRLGYSATTAATAVEGRRRFMEVRSRVIRMHSDLVGKTRLRWPEGCTNKLDRVLEILIDSLMNLDDLGTGLSCVGFVSGDVELGHEQIFEILKTIELEIEASGQTATHDGGDESIDAPEPSAEANVSVGPPSPTPERRTDPEARYQTANPSHDRDAWMYSLRKDEGWSLKEIRVALARHTEWERITTEQGVQRAIDRHANRNGLPIVRTRQDGKPGAGEFSPGRDEQRPPTIQFNAPRLERVE